MVVFTVFYCINSSLSIIHLFLPIMLKDINLGLSHVNFEDTEANSLSEKGKKGKTARFKQRFTI